MKACTVETEALKELQPPTDAEAENATRTAVLGGRAAYVRMRKLRTDDKNLPDDVAAAHKLFMASVHGIPHGMGSAIARAQKHLHGIPHARMVDT